MRTPIASLFILALAACNMTTNQELDVANDPAAEAETEAETASDMTEADSSDPYLWLEEVEGDKALAWVRAQNERSLGELKSDPRYAANEKAALDIATAKERIPYGTVRDGLVYNFWQDEQNVRGLWRRTTLERYATADPEWETILDFDNLAEDEGKNWVYKGANCFKPKDGDKYLCMVSLSDGGKDAVVQREFDLSTKTFVQDGFVTPEAKQGIAWVDYDTLLVATDWGDGTVTESGYPYIVKRWTRGTPLSEATEIIRGEATDVGVWPYTIELEDGTILTGAVEADTFFTSTYWLFDPETGERKIPVPPKSTPNGIYKGKFLVSLEQDWTPDGSGQSFKSGDLIAFSVDHLMPEAEGTPDYELVFRPNETQAVNGVAVAKGAALLSINENVIGKVLRLEPTERGWSTTAVRLPGTGQAGIAFADKDEEAVFLNYEGFLTPDSLLSYDIQTGQVTSLKSLPAKFNTGRSYRGPALRHIKGWYESSLLRHPPRGHSAGWLHTDIALWLWRFPGQPEPLLQCNNRQAVAGEWRSLCSRQYPRRRRVWPGLAPGRPERQPPTYL